MKKLRVIVFLFGAFAALRAFLRPKSQPANTSSVDNDPAQG